MLDNKYKVNIDFLFCNKTYPFIYHMKTTKLGQFPDLSIFFINNFQVCTIVAIEVQL